jgi:hypothetical protein
MGLAARGLSPPSTLVRCEEHFGGLVSEDGRDGRGPELQLGPYLVLQREAELAFAFHGIADGSDLLEKRQWPVVAYENRDLWLVGVLPWDVSVYLDEQGHVWTFADECDLLVCQATSMRMFLERQAFAAELVASPSYAAPLEVDADLGEALARSLGLARDEDASDAVSAWYVGTDTQVKSGPATGPHPGATWVFARALPALLAAARLARQLVPGVRLGVNGDKHGVERCDALRAAGLYDGLPLFRPW